MLGGRRSALLVLAAAWLASGPAAASPSDGDGPEGPGQFPVTVPAKPGATDLTFETPLVTRQRADRLRNAAAPSGALSGKTVYVSAGHGWNYEAAAWRTQRGNTFDLVEDLLTAELVDQYLVPYLQAMGAYVVPIRESDLNPNMVVVDDGDATVSGSVTEGATGTGWGPIPVPFTGAQDPFALGSSRTLTSSTEHTGSLVFATAVPQSGYYNVYVSYVQGADRVRDAHVIVNHAGGASHVRLDQRRHGSTWVLLGRWYFEAGADASRASIAFANDSAEAGRVISVDAVRLGGGMAPHVRNGKTTQRPAYESAGRYSAQLLGAPASVWNFFGDDASGNDVVSRPRFAAWEHESGEDAIYLAVHTNAPSPSRGTMSIAYGNTYPCCAGREDFAGTAGSLQLLDAVHDEIVADLRRSWDPTWRDAGKVTAALGELRPTHNGEMPAILVELAFHATLADADALREPRFRMLAARAMAQGVAKYFATKDQRALVLPPETPSAIRVENVGDGQLRVSWRPHAADPAGGGAPTGYRVHLSDNGYGFDDGVEVDGESTVLRDLPPGTLVFVRVVATNAGGDSQPSEVVGARVAHSGKAPILIVGGVDRLDAAQAIREAAPLVGTLDRIWIDRMNNGTYAARHASALADGGFSFDGATDDAVELRDIDLTAYRGIDWFVGEDSAGNDPLPADSRTELARFFMGGGSLLISGSEMIWALDERGSPETQMFVRELLHTSLDNDDAGTTDVTPIGELFGSVGPLSFANEGPLDYDVDFPDVLAPAGTATPVLAYASGGTAAIAWRDGVGGSRGIVVGFPVEMIGDDAARSALLTAAFASFGIEPDPEPDPTDPDLMLDGGCGCSSHGTESGASTVLLVGLAAIVLRRRRRRSSRRCAHARAVVAVAAVVAVVLVTSTASAEPILGNERPIWEPGAVSLTSAQRRARAEIIRDTAASLGMTNAALLAGIGEVETNFAHCWSEATWACKGPASSSCGGGPVIAGSADGPCSYQQGGLGMFQFDAGTYAQTIAAYGSSIVTIQGNVDAVVPFLVTRAIQSVNGVGNAAEALAWMNSIKIQDGDPQYEKWLYFVAWRYNGCQGCTTQINKYRAGTNKLRDEFEPSFWDASSEPSACDSIPGKGRTIGETDGCFVKEGTPTSWYPRDAGDGGACLITYTTDETAPDNHATWEMTFDASGRYRVEVYTDASLAQTHAARYTVTHAGGDTDVVIDQTSTTGYQLLGDFEFTADEPYAVHLGDNTGEAYVSTAKIAIMFDSVRVTPAPADGDGDGDDNGDDGSVDMTGGCTTGGSPAGPLAIILVLGAACRRRRLGRGSRPRAASRA